MSPRLVRQVVLAVCGLGITGMIVGSITDRNGLALTAGLVTAAASLCLIVATAVAAPAGGDTAAEEAAARVERQVEALVEAGADEAAVRALAKAAVELGKARGGAP